MSANPEHHFLNYPASLKERMEREWGKVKPQGYYPNVQEFEDVYYVPEHKCLYTHNGTRITESCLYRGPGKDELITKAPAKIAPPGTSAQVSKTHIYIGILRAHYGHFLTESLGRLWYAEEDTSLPLIYHGANMRNLLSRTFVGDFFRALNWPLERFVRYEEPVFLKHVIVPQPSFVNRGEFYSIHSKLCQIAAKNLLVTKSLAPSSQPLYLSRTLMPEYRRSIWGEDRLQEMLAQNGIAVCHPQKLSLAEQIMLVNRHPVIIGMQGSALHNILFRLSGDLKLFCISEATGVNINYLFMDRLAGCSTTYIAGLDRAEEPGRLPWVDPRNLRFEEIRNALSMMGVL